MKQHRTKVIKAIEAAMEAETDPQKKVEYAKQLAKLLPRPRQARRPRKSDGETTAKSKGTSPIIDKWADRLSHLSIEKRIQFSVIKEVEERLQKQGIKVWPETAESRAALQKEWTEVLGTLNEEERLVFTMAQAESQGATESEAAQRAAKVPGCQS